jgi:cytolysin-activating lysine-acyltransferase
MDDSKSKKSEASGAPAGLSTDAVEMAKLGLEHAKSALAKLPILGPALWLYARDPIRKFTFLADMDWQLLPPMVLDQCQLYSKDGIPFAFFTWARVSDEIDARLRGGVPRIAPHEWQSGQNCWLIDMVLPFGQLEETLSELRRTALAGQTVRALLPDPQKGGKAVMREWPAAPVESTKH